MFAQFGKITLVRVLLPGRQVPCDLRNYATQVPDMGNTLCAVVEFDSETEACTACRELNAKRFPSGMRSALLGPRLRRNLYKVTTPMTTTTNVPPGFEKFNDENSKINDTFSMNPMQTAASSENSSGSSFSQILPSNIFSGNWATKNTGLLVKKDSGCDTASHTSSSPQVFRKDSIGSVLEESILEKTKLVVSKTNELSSAKPSFDRAPGAGRRQVKTSLSIQLSENSIIRQPRGPGNTERFIEVLKNDFCYFF